MQDGFRRRKPLGLGELYAAHNEKFIQGSEAAFSAFSTLGIADPTESC